MKKAASIFFILIFCSLNLFSQNNEQQQFRPKQFFLGVQPDGLIYKDDYNRNVFEVNILPVQLEYAVNQRWSVRLTPRVFKIFIPEHPNEVSRIGMGATVPYHFSKKNSEEGHRGFYIGPHASMHMDRLHDFTEVTGAAEVGYYFLLGSAFSVNFGAQVGRTYRLDPNNPFTQIDYHKAAVLAFGFWF